MAPPSRHLRFSDSLHVAYLVLSRASPETPLKTSNRLHCGLGLRLVSLSNGPRHVSSNSAFNPALQLRSSPPIFRKIDIQYRIIARVVRTIASTTLSCHRLYCALECPCLLVQIAVCPLARLSYRVPTSVDCIVYMKTLRPEHFLETVIDSALPPNL
jgi:hypothetical protein